MGEHDFIFWTLLWILFEVDEAEVEVLVRFVLLSGVLTTTCVAFRE